MPIRQRQANVESILNAVQQNMVDNKGLLTGCPTLSSTATVIKTGSPGIDMAPCLSAYLAVLPVDPQTPGTWTSVTNYNTGYTIRTVGSNGQIEIAAPNALTDSNPSAGVNISVTR